MHLQRRVFKDGLLRSVGIISLAIGAASAVAMLAVPVAANSDPAFILAQAMVPPTGIGDADRPMPMAERMNRRFPQPVRVGDVIGLPIVDDDNLTLGYVRQVVRTPQHNIKLIVAFNRWCGWCDLNTRLIAVPIEAVGIVGRELASLDMPRSAYDSAPTWQGADATVLANNDSIRVALARH